VAKDLVLEMDSAHLTPAALALAFRTLVGAGQHKAAHALYCRLASKVPTGESSPLFAAQVLSPLVLSVRSPLELQRDPTANVSHADFSC
jgi:hypothetical protein